MKDPPLFIYVDYIVKRDGQYLFTRTSIFIYTDVNIHLQQQILFANSHFKE